MDPILSGLVAAFDAGEPTGPMIADREPGYVTTSVPEGLVP